MSPEAQSVVAMNPAADSRSLGHGMHRARHGAGASVKPASSTVPGTSHSAFVPLLLGLLALLAWLSSQTLLLAAERGALGIAREGQQQTVDKAGTLRASLDALAADTQRLADTGNANAALLVTELKKRGITINPGAPAQQSAIVKP